MPDERADVLVMGSGAAGAAIAWRLAERGAKVVCLEQGDWVKPSDYPSTRPTWETQLLRGPFHWDPNVRRRPEDYPVTDATGRPAGVAMFNGVGGTTIHWSGLFPRFHPSDFRVKTLDGVGDDWPISYKDLEPYYDLNDRMMGVAGLNGDPANPPRSARPTPPLPIGRYAYRIGRAFDQLNWHWWVSDNAIISRDYDGRPGCNLHGMCNYGCFLGAKASTNVTYWPKAIRRGAVLRTRARVREITVDPQGRARGALYYDRRGNLTEQLARVVVVCGNGIGTPRLLLNSKSRLFPDGIGNSSGLVGKNLMFHPMRGLTGIFREELDSHFGPPIPLISQQFYETDTSRGFVRGYLFWLNHQFGPVQHSVGTYFGPPAPWGTEHHREMRRRFPHAVSLYVLGEDLPEEINRVELDPTVKDRNGIPAARILYRYSENSLRMLDHGARMARQVLEAAGAVEVLDSGPIPFGTTAHLMGTARMGSDPKNSVINAWHQAHDVRNLFIVDGSSFTTSAGVNPTSTIGALALRCADGIWERRRD